MSTLRTAISALAVAAALGVSAGPAAAATVLNVNWSDSCGKATCFDQDGVYSQTFSANDFTGPVTVGQLLMQRGVLGAMDGSTFTISFSLNGAELGTWGHYNMAGIGGDELNFWGENFTWNPDMGDLVLTLAIDPPPMTGGGGFFFASPDEFPGGSDFRGSEQGAFGDEGPGPGGPGDVGSVPEPATWAMMILGFGAAGVTLRRRRTLRAA